LKRSPMGQPVLGRTSNTETGSFTTEITALDLSGALALPGSQFDGVTLDLSLGVPTSSGMTSITPDGGCFKIDSFLDAFVDVSLIGTGFSVSGLHVPRGWEVDFERARQAASRWAA
jgi:hypothetical protein